MDNDHAMRITDIASRVEEALRLDPPVGIDYEVVRFAPPAARTLPLPSYVEHREDVDEAGKAVSEVIVQQYERAIKSLEAMGKDLIGCVKQLHDMAERCVDTVRFVSETCDLYREDSKIIFTRIERCSALTAEVRKVCEDMRSKIKNEKLERLDPGHSNSKADEKPADQPAGLPGPVVCG